ncbi:MAG: alcohol dehydrogenase catalytic domain-containing protein [Chloroflexota bacterium]
MKAVLLPGHAEVRVTERPEPEPGSGEVLVRIQACALCRSDMSLYDGVPVVGGGASPGRIIPGHEAADDVVSLGSWEADVAVDDRVAIYLALGCGRYTACRRGYLMLCQTWRCLGFDVDGGDAEFVVGPATNCLPTPDTMTYEVAAVSTDMIGTQYSTQKRLGVSGADTVAIFGLGPMGVAGVLVAKARGARVIAVERDGGRLELAQALGADAVVDAESPDVAGQLRAARAVRAWTWQSSAPATLSRGTPPWTPPAHWGPPITVSILRRNWSLVDGRGALFDARRTDKVVFVPSAG